MFLSSFGEVCLVEHRRKKMNLRRKFEFFLRVLNLHLCNNFFLITIVHLFCSAKSPQVHWYRKNRFQDYLFVPVE